MLHLRFKPHTHTPTFAESALESALESADSSSVSDDSNADTPVGMSSSADCQTGIGRPESALSRRPIAGCPSGYGPSLALG